MLQYRSCDEPAQGHITIKGGDSYPYVEMSEHEYTEEGEVITRRTHFWLPLGTRQNPNAVLAYRLERAIWECSDPPPSEITWSRGVPAAFIPGPPDNRRVRKIK